MHFSVLITEPQKCDKESPLWAWRWLHLLATISSTNIRHGDFVNLAGSRFAVNNAGAFRALPLWFLVLSEDTAIQPPSWNSWKSAAELVVNLEMPCDDTDVTVDSHPWSNLLPC